MIKLEKTDEYQDWFTGLSDKLVKARIEARIRRLQDGNPGNVGPVGEGVSELKLHFGSGCVLHRAQRANHYPAGRRQQEHSKTRHQTCADAGA